MYKNYLILINDYVFTLKKDVWFDIMIPCVIATVIGICLKNDYIVVDKSFLTNILSVLGILAGFSITSITILTSTSNNSIVELKRRLTGIIIDGVSISIFRKLYILISYSVLVCLFAIILNTIGYLIPITKFFIKTFVSIIKAVDVFIILHIFFVNIRNITSLYFLFFNETNLESENGSENQNSGNQELG